MMVTSRVCSSWVKVAVSSLLASMVMDQDPSSLSSRSPVLGPDQPAKDQSGEAVGVRITEVPWV